MRIIKGTEDNKVVTSKLAITTHKVDELIGESDTYFTEADRTYACLYQNHVSRMALIRTYSTEEEREAQKHETDMRLRQLGAWRSDVRNGRKNNYVQIHTFLNEIHGEGWDK